MNLFSYWKKKKIALTVSLSTIVLCSYKLGLLEPVLFFFFLYSFHISALSNNHKLIMSQTRPNNQWVDSSWRIHSRKIFFVANQVTAGPILWVFFCLDILAFNLPLAFFFFFFLSLTEWQKRKKKKIRAPFKRMVNINIV